MEVVHGQARQPAGAPDAPAAREPLPIRLPRHRHRNRPSRPATSRWPARRAGFRVDKKGTIDLVTEVDLECERMCPRPDRRAISRSRRARRGAERGPRRRAVLPIRWVFDPLDGTTNYAHGLPIFCSSLALEIDGRAEVGGGLRPDARASCSPPSGAAARSSTARRLRRSTAADADRRAAGDRLSLRRPQAARRPRRSCSAPSWPGTGGAATGIGGARPVLRRRGPVRRLLGTASQAVGRRRRRADRDRGRRRRYRDGRQPVRCAAAHLVASNGPLHARLLDVIREFRAGRS